MTNFYRQSSFGRPKKGRRVLVVATLVALVVLLADWLSGGLPRGVTRSAVAGVSSGVTSAIDSTLQTGFFSSRASLARDNAALRNEITRLREEAAAAKILEAENASLRALTGVAEAGSGITAPVLSSFRASPYGTFIVGAGREDGVALGTVVVTEGGFVLGRVSEAGERRSTVRAVFAPGVQSDVLIGETPASLEGKGGGNATARVSRDAPVVEGDAVTSPEFTGRPVGIVGKVERSDSGAYADVYVRIPVNLDTLRYVFLDL